MAGLLFDTSRIFTASLPTIESTFSIGAPVFAPRRVTLDGTTRYGPTIAPRTRIENCGIRGTFDEMMNHSFRSPAGASAANSTLMLYSRLPGVRHSASGTGAKLEDRNGRSFWNDALEISSGVSCNCLTRTVCL